LDAAEVVARFGLEPLAGEGGLFRRYWCSPPDAERPDGTAILFLLTDAPAGFSQFHRLTRDEVWHRYLGDPAELVLLAPDGSSRSVLLGDDVVAGHDIVHVVAAGTWMAARTTGRWSLLGTTMAPGFTPDAYEDGDPAVLTAGWPSETPTIAALTRPPGSDATSVRQADGSLRKAGAIRSWCTGSVISRSRGQRSKRKGRT
jgi:uncharacterized protein